jgi:hypothetical protein
MIVTISSGAFLIDKLTGMRGSKTAPIHAILAIRPPSTTRSWAVM